MAEIFEGIMLFYNYVVNVDLSNNTINLGGHLHYEFGVHPIRSICQFVHNYDDQLEARHLRVCFALVIQNL